MPAETDKNARLASALRANLARRKAQGRARAAESEGEGAQDGPRVEKGAPRPHPEGGDKP